MPFACYATFHLEEHARLLDELPHLELELRRVLALRPCREPLQVLIFADETEHRAYLAERFRNIPYRRALFVKNGKHASVFAYLHPELGIDLRHECTHALLHADLPMVPLWLDEGLAEYFEAPARERAFQNPHFKRLRWDIWLNNIPDLPELEKKHELDQLSGADYRHAWAWSHFLLHGPRAAAEQLWGFLGDIRRRTPPGDLSNRLVKVLGQPRERLISHFKSWRPPSNHAS